MHIHSLRVYKDTPDNWLSVEEAVTYLVDSCLPEHVKLRYLTSEARTTYNQSPNAGKRAFLRASGPIIVANGGQELGQRWEPDQITAIGLIPQGESAQGRIRYQVTNLLFDSDHITDHLLVLVEAQKIVRKAEMAIAVRQYQGM